MICMITALAGLQSGVGISIQDEFSVGKLMIYKEGNAKIAVYAGKDQAEPVHREAAELARHLGVRLIEDAQEADRQREEGLLLTAVEDGLSLCHGKLTMKADLTAMLPRLRQANLEREMLVKAARIKGIEHIRLVDATAGMGEDSLLLAAAGYDVTMYEYDGVIAALLRDALKRGKQDPGLSDAIGRMRLIEDDSIAAMRRMAESDESQRPDVVLLDPMFPSREKSALIKKKFQLLQQLELPCDNEKDLLDAAYAAKPRKIVIKRPLKGPYLAGVKPHYSLSGKAIRYDCMIL